MKKVDSSEIIFFKRCFLFVWLLFVFLGFFDYFCFFCFTFFREKPLKTVYYFFKEKRHQKSVIKLQSCFVRLRLPTSDNRSEADRK